MNCFFFFFFFFFNGAIQDSFEYVMELYIMVTKFFIWNMKLPSGYFFSSNLILFCWYRVSVPLILSLPATVLSLTKKDQLKVCHSKLLIDFSK
jgi:hypothetical protein